ncbi:hypothetical protein [Streptomyces lunalinharesii]|uniref:Uncharacterized protein n=1 Tax=Streptomyces lunalinharesii TaxID=333384 RepID=A0ABN3SKY4_9ACTN
MTNDPNHDAVELTDADLDSVAGGDGEVTMDRQPTVPYEQEPQGQVLPTVDREYGEPALLATPREPNC